MQINWSDYRRFFDAKAYAATAVIVSVIALLAYFVSPWVPLVMAAVVLYFAAIVAFVVSCEYLVMVAWNMYQHFQATRKPEPGPELRGDELA